MRLSDYFDLTYVINLPNRADRRKEMAAELEKVGMSFAPGKVEIFSAIRPDSPGEFKSIGYRGAFLSHLGVLKKAKELGLNNVLIMEDDLEFRADFPEYEEAILEELTQQNWDIVHFGYITDKVPAKVEPPILHAFSGEIIGAQFYAVNGQALDEVINFFEVLLERPKGHPEGGPMSPDGVFNVFKWQHPHRDRLLAEPSFGGQRSSKSDISPKWFDNVPIINSLASTARVLARATRSKGQ